jgi:hypothetical protein
MSTSTVGAGSFLTHPFPSSIERSTIDNLPDAPLSDARAGGTGTVTFDLPDGMSTVTFSAW